jgi:hypothetical protein
MALYDRSLTNLASEDDLAATQSPLSFALPTDWGVAGGLYDEEAEKINYYNTQGITPEMLLASSYGVTQSDIDWMRQHGYTVGAGATQGALSGAADTVTSSAGVDTVTSSVGTDTTQENSAKNLKDFVSGNITNPQAIAQYAQRFGLGLDDLALAMGSSPTQVQQYFRDAGFPLGTMLTGTLQRTMGTDTGIRQLDKGEDVVAERAIGMQGNKVLVQQYDAYGQPTGTRLAEPNAPDYVGWIQALGLVLPGALPGVGEAIGSALGATGAAASAIGSGAINFALQIAGGADPVDALKGAVLSAGAGFVGSQISSMLPAEIAGAGKNAITQLITTGKLDPAALATSVGTSFATDALAAETGMDKATAGKLVTAGLQAFQGNELAALTSLAQAGIQSGLAGTGVTAQSPQDRAAFLDANAAPQGAGALSPIAAEDEQIAIQQRQNAANQALTDYMGSGNDLSREGLVSQLQSLGLTADQAEGYAQKADQQINMQRVGADVMNRYSKIDPEFGTPQLDRNAALEEMVAAGFSSDRANEILNGIDAQNAIKLENKLSVQSAYNNLTKGTGTEEQLRSAMTSAGYTDNEINNLVTKGLGILEGSKLTAGEQAQERVSQLPDVRAEISAKPTFSEAYKLARDTYGSGATFTWQGKSYSTDTFQENPALGLVPVAGSGRGQAAGKTAEQEAALLATAEELKRIDPVARASLLDSASVDYGAVSPEGNAQGLTQTAADKLVQSVIPVNAIKTAFGMTTEAAGNTLKAFGTIGESLGFNTAQMSDYGRKLENIAQELYPQALRTSESEVKNRFASANSAADIGRALKDSILNNPGAVAKMIGVEGLQELPNIALALATGGTSALIRYGGMLAGLGLDVVESAGLQGAQKVDEGLAKGLTRAQAVKSAVDDMKAAGAVTAVMTAAADKIPFGGTIAKTMIKGSAGEGIEEYVIARATGQDHMSALRQAAFGALIGGPTEATLQGAGNLTNVTINGDTMIGTYADGTKVSISEPAGATDLKIDIIKPTDTSVNVSNALTADLSSGADLTTSINSVVSNNITADLSGTIDSTVKAVINNGVDLSQGVTNLTSAAVANTGDTTAVINNVVSSLASNGTDLNANAGSIVTGAVSGGASVTDAVDTTLKAVTANGGNVADAAASIITSVSASGDTAQVANATTAVINAAITSGSNVTATTSNAVNAALAASGGSTDAVTQVVGGIASQGNNDATAAAVSSAVATTGDTSAAVNAALTNGGDANTVLSTASNAAITAGTDTNTAVTNTLTSALNNNVDTTTAVNSTVKGALDAGADASVVVNSATTAAVTNNVDTSSAITNTVTAALNNNADVSAVVDSVIKTSLDNGIDTASVVTSVITAALNNNADVSQVVSTVINTAANNNADTSAVIDNAVTTAITNGADTSAVINSAVKAAVDAGTDSTSAIDSTLTAVANAGGDVAQAVGSAVDASLAAGADTSQTLIAATSTAITNGGDASTVVSNVVNSAVNNGASLADATASSVATAIVSGADANTVIQTLTNSNSNLAIESGSSGDVTTVLASDGTSNTQVTMDAGSQTVTTTTTDTTTGETKQVTIQGDTTTTVTTNNSGVTTSVTVDESTGVKTEITSDAGSVTSITTDTTGSTTEIKSDVDTGVVTQIVSNPDRDQIVTTTWNADNTVTVTTKSGDGPEATETLTADVAPVKPKLDPIAAVVPVQAAQATKTTAPKAAAPKASFKLPSAAASGLSMPMASSDYDLGVLKSSGDTRIKNPLEALMERVEQMNQIDPMLAAVMSQRLGIQPQQAPTFTYGQETSIDDILGLREPKKPEMEEALYAEGGYVEPLRAKGGAMNLQFMNRGGVLPGGREDFKDGKHVAGDGDGQSDDIPAWLADGEFVFPADVVSALGNGSTKAGTDKLYKMMHEIRARARSTKVKDLPPPAHKSPLDYIKKGK